VNAIVERYNRDAADYERYWAPVLEGTAHGLLHYIDGYVGFVVRRDGGVRILEVGSGTGSLVLRMLEHWPQASVIATDGAAAMVERTRDRVTAAGFADRAEFLTGPAHSLPVADASVDMVISTFVMQLVPDRIDALREAHRVLAPAGMVAYLTWLDRDAREPFLPAEEFDEAVYDLDVDEPDGPDEPHAGDVGSGRTATSELRRAGFIKATAHESVLDYEWTMESYLEYKLEYDERSFLELLSDEQRASLVAKARERLSRLEPREFTWHAPVVFARAEKPR
jgi:ubiquinone/menaquinone biosynthesis C-methylase UbiE